MSYLLHDLVDGGVDLLEVLGQDLIGFVGSLLAIEIAYIPARVMESQPVDARWNGQPQCSAIETQAAAMSAARELCSSTTTKPGLPR